MNFSSWRNLSIAAFWAQVAGAFGLCAFVAWQTPTPNWVDVLDVLRYGVNAVVLSWAATLWMRLSRGQASPPSDGTWRALRFGYPVLTSLRLLLWLPLFLAAFSPDAQANPMTLATLLGITAGFIFCKNAVFEHLLMTALEPAQASHRRRLSDWLNWAAAFALAQGAVNVLSAGTDQAVMWAYGLTALLDVVASLLCLKVLDMTLAGQPDEEQPD